MATIIFCYLGGSKLILVFYMLPIEATVTAWMEFSLAPYVFGTFSHFSTRAKRLNLAQHEGLRFSCTIAMKSFAVPGILYFIWNFQTKSTDRNQKICCSSFSEAIKYFTQNIHWFCRQAVSYQLSVSRSIISFQYHRSRLRYNFARHICSSSNVARNYSVW